MVKISFRAKKKVQTNSKLTIRSVLILAVLDLACFSLHIQKSHPAHILLLYLAALPSLPYVTFSFLAAL